MVGARVEVGVEQVPAELAAAVISAKGSDPLAPVTVVTSSGYAAVFVRRALAQGTASDGLRGVANVDATTLSKLVQGLGSSLLSSRGLRPASAAVELEAVRTEALEAGGWLGRFASHARSLATLERAVRELRRCPAGVLDSLASRDRQAAALVTLAKATRRRLHARCYADESDLALAALERVREGVPFEVGPLLTWHLGRCPELDRRLLDRLNARPIEGASPYEDRSRSVRPVLDQVRPCADPDEEARAAVRTVLKEAEKGVPLWRQAIFHPPDGGYGQVLHHHLERAGLGANGPGMRHLDRCAAARALLGLLDVADGNFERDQVAAWFASAPLSTGERGRAVPASRWDALSAAAGVVRGPEQWRERLAHYAATHESDAKDAGALAEFMSGIRQSIADPGHTWADLASWACRLLDSYVDPSADGDTWPEDEVAARAQVREVLGSLCELDEVSVETDLSSFRFALERVLRRTEISEETSDGGRFGDGVFVAPFGTARGLRFHQVVVCGLADSMVPGPCGIDPLLREDLRLFDTSGTLRTRERAQQELRDDLECALHAGAVRRVATLPRCDPRSGRTQYPSRWLRELADGTQWVPVESFAAGVASEDPALSASELELRAIDRWLGCGGEVADSPVAAADRRLSAGFEAVTSRRGSDFTRFDGLVGFHAVSPFNPEAPVSATRFETYAHCPRRYLLERALRVSRRVLPEDLWKIEAATRGSLVHAILEDYVAQRLAGEERSLERLLAIADAHLDEAEGSGLVGKRLMWRMERAGIVRELRRFHSEEGDLRPLSVELAFGDDGGGSPPVTVALEDGREVRFRGSADRVDRTRAGRLVVSDYKTGRQSGLSALTKDPLAGGTLLQLPLYAMAARQRFAGGSTDPVHARYWLLSSERSAPCYHLVVTEEIEARFRHVVGRIASSVEAGCFPATPGAALYDGRFENCRTCDFDSLCPPERERQWNRKQSDPRLRPFTKVVNDELPESLCGAVVKGFVDPDVTEARELADTAGPDLDGGERS